MKKELSFIRQLQKQAIDAALIVSGKASALQVEATAGLKKLDEHLAITVKVKETGEKIGSFVQQTDQNHGISEKAKALKQVAMATTIQAKDVARRVAEDSGFNKHASNLGDVFKKQIGEPTAEWVKKSGLDQKASRMAAEIEHVYGSARAKIKPYFEAETTEVLLLNTKKELTYISACIMQISAGEAEKVAGQFGAAIASKITGAATATALLALVSSFGTAGTGTAIASLSGAAATNATLAWVGGLFGGGMAAGAVLTGGLSIVVGLGAYKMLSSERRAFERLSTPEQRIVQSCWLLIAMIDALLVDKNRIFNSDTSTGLLNNTLLPLQVMLIEHTDDICVHLDNKNAVAFRQHVLIDFQRVVIDGFNNFIESNATENSRHYEYVIAGVFYALLSRSAVDDSMESQLVLKALRRSSTSLKDASEAELSDYLDRYDAEELKGIANNTKGIYHEELWVHQYNETHEGTYAEMFGATNHPGADIQIKSCETHEVVDEVQLKATDSVAYVNEHVERYPDIEVVVTNETANRMDDIHSSGIDNAEITEKVNHDLEAVADNTIGDRVLNSAELSAAIASGHGLIEMLRGKKDFPQSVTDTVKRVGAASAATVITAYLFS